MAASPEEVALDTVTVSEAKAQLSKLMERVLAGERIAIGRRGRPEVVLQAYAGAEGPRPLGTYDGPFFMADDFDDTPDEVVRGFQGG